MDFIIIGWLSTGTTNKFQYKLEKVHLFNELFKNQKYKKVVIIITDKG